MSLLWNDPFVADPFIEMRRMQKDMDQLLASSDVSLLEAATPSSAVVPQGTNFRELTNWRPRVDVKSSDKNITIQAELPGVRKEDISIDLTNGLLTLSGKRSEEKKEENEKYHRTERFFGNFTRSFTVPKGVTEKDIRANFENGILQITLPKPGIPEQKKHLINIQ